MRRVAGLAAAAVLGAGPASFGAERDAEAVFSAACLATLPGLARAADGFAAAGWAETEAGPELAPARLFGEPQTGLGMVETEIAGGAGPTATCTVLFGPSPTLSGTVERLDAEIAELTGLDTPPECLDLGPIRSCTWMWADPTGCRSVIATEAGGQMKSLVAVSIDTERDCFEVSP